MAKNKKKSAVKKTRFMLELSLAEAFGWGGLLVFICGWFFILGIFVGRGLVPLADQNEPVKQQLAKARKTSQAGPVKTIESKPKTQIVKKPAVQRKQKPPPPQTAPAAAPDPPEKPPVKNKDVQKETEAKPDETGEDIFTIQVAALREQEAADQLFSKLKKEGYTPFMVKATLSDNATWYRVRCGRFTDRVEAAPALDRLRKDGYSPILTRR